MGLYRRNGHAGDGGDIGQVHLLDKTHQENAALLAGEFLQGFVDHLYSFSGDQLRFGRAFAAGQVLAHVAGIDRAGRSRLPEAKFLALGVVAHQVERDPHQPGAYAAIATKLVSGQMSLEETILGDRFRRITVWDGERDKAEYLAKAILNLREIQEEIERAGSEIKRELISWNIQLADTRSRYPYYRNTRFRMR